MDAEFVKSNSSACHGAGFHCAESTFGCVESPCELWDGRHTRSSTGSTPRLTHQYAAPKTYTAAMTAKTSDQD